MVRIREPIWKSKSIGIRSDRVDELVEITYTDKHGERLWPGKYRVNQEKLDSHSKMLVGRNRAIECTVVPICDLLCRRKVCYSRFKFCPRCNA